MTVLGRVTHGPVGDPTPGPPAWSSGGPREGARPKPHPCLPTTRTDACWKLRFTRADSDLEIETECHVPGVSISILVKAAHVVLKCASVSTHSQTW